MSWEGFVCLIVSGAALAVAMRTNIHLGRLHDRNRVRFEANRGRIRRAEGRLNSLELEAEGLREHAA